MANWLKRITPVLLVDEIEPCLAFWDALGFEKTAEVPHDGRLGFVIFEKSGLEIMYQTRASVAADIPALADAPGAGTFLFLEVMDLEATIEAVEGAPVVFPRRKTFYGMDEICVREPGGNTVTFAMAVSD
ncbi:MAG: VOC family protein [Gemmatimonas sp.]|nr:VOC family protein [Gemmatimonas sp.]